MDQGKLISLLESLLASAQTGRNYARDYHNQQRYDDILEKIKGLYELIPQFQSSYIPKMDQTGYITPKVGVNAIIRNEKGQFLLEKRKDDHSWCIIGGWCEPQLSPEQNIIKEVREETGLEVSQMEMVHIFSRTANDLYPYSSYHIVYACEVEKGDIQISEESDDVAFWDFDEVSPWHYDHKEWIAHYLKNKE